MLALMQMRKLLLLIRSCISDGLYSLIDHEQHYPLPLLGGPCCHSGLSPLQMECLLHHVDWLPELFGVRKRGSRSIWNLSTRRRRRLHTDSRSLLALSCRLCDLLFRDAQSGHVDSLSLYQLHTVSLRIQLQLFQRRMCSLFSQLCSLWMHWGLLLGDLLWNLCSWVHS